MRLRIRPAGNLPIVFSTSRFYRTLLALCLLIVPVSGQRPFDDQTGADPANYPPGSPVDFIHLKLDLRFEDLATRSFEGTATLFVRPVHEQVTSLRLDAWDLRIEEVRVDDVVVDAWRYDDRILHISFLKPLPMDATTSIAVRYQCVEPVYGMIWALPDEAYPDRPPVIHTQGEPEFSRYWFPAIDHPIDRCTSEVIADVPAGMTAISNGRLVERREDPATGRTVFHHHQEEPHVFYLVSLVIGPFEEVRDTWRSIDVQYFVPVGQADRARLTYGRTPEMLDFFSNLFGYDYPYAKYSQVNVPLFMFGGMENTSATTMADTALLDERAALDQNLEGLIAHELAHQWFGDLLTCRGWKHLWLNEGFATFLDTLWKEHAWGRDEYLYAFWKRYRHVSAHDTTEAGPPILFDDYRHPFETFRIKGSMPYQKGSCVLHMLRHELGDTLFWRGVQRYLWTHANQEVETNDLRRALELVSGRNLEHFFTQWVARPGVPHLKVDYRWDAEESEAVVRVVQTQAISRAVPAFNVPLDLYFRAGDETLSATMRVDERTATFRHRFAVPPDLFCVDPHAGLLMKMDCEKPRPMWLRQLAEGPTIVSRVVAAAHLARHNRPEVVAALRDTAADTAEPWMIRVEAAKALAAMRSHRGRDALLALLSDPALLEDHAARAGIIEAAGAYDDLAIGGAIAPFAISDPSSKVEAVATDALGKIHAFPCESILLENVKKESYQYQIRNAALRAMGRRTDPRFVDVALAYAAYGHHDRVRPVAIDTLSRLALRFEDRRDDIRRSLIHWLMDPQERTVQAAIRALGALDDRESRAALEAFLNGSPEPQAALLARDTLAQERTSADAEAIQSLHQAIDSLREQVLTLRERLDRLAPAHHDEAP